MTKTTRNKVKRLFKQESVNYLPQVSESIMYAYIYFFFICNQNNCSRELNHNRDPDGPSRGHLLNPRGKCCVVQKQFLVLPLRLTLKVAFFSKL